MGLSPEDIQFITEEFERIFIGDRDLRSLCSRNAPLFLPDGPAAIPAICDRITDALRDRTPISLLRLGDEEGIAMGMTKPAPLHPLQISTFYEEFLSQNDIAVPQDAAIALCREIRTALNAADIIGFRSFGTDEATMIRDSIKREWAYAALGFLYARELLQQGMTEGCWRRSVVTSAWIHLDIIPHLSTIFDRAESIIVITGRAELHDEARSRLGERLEAFITVPVQGFVPPSPEQSHLLRAFPDVRQRLSQDLRGKLVLVGAGLFGKVYCHVAKLHGAVAIDLGSAFDILAGLSTRPVHKNYDIGAMRWI